MPMYYMERDMSSLAAIISTKELSKQKFRVILANLSLEFDDAQQCKEKAKK